MRSIIAGKLPTILFAVVSQHDTRILQSEAAAKGIVTVHNNYIEREIGYGRKIENKNMKRYRGVVVWEEIDGLV